MQAFARGPIKALDRSWSKHPSFIPKFESRTSGIWSTIDEYSLAWRPAIVPACLHSLVATWISCWVLLYFYGIFFYMKCYTLSNIIYSVDACCNANSYLYSLLRHAGLKLKGTHQLLAYADDVNLMGDNIDTINFLFSLYLANLQSAHKCYE
jgi:hypothetical protein